MKGLSQIMRQAQEMQANMQKVQNELAATEVEGVAGGGMVKVVVTCKHEVKRVTIESSLLSDDRHDAFMQGVRADYENVRVARAARSSADRLVPIEAARANPLGWR